MNLLFFFWGGFTIVACCIMAPCASPEVISFTAVITACDKSSQWHCAVALLPQMDTAKVTPDDVCFLVGIELQRSEKVATLGTSDYQFTSDSQ